MRTNDDTPTRRSTGDDRRDITRSVGSVLAILALLTMAVDELRKLGAAGGRGRPGSEVTR